MAWWERLARGSRPLLALLAAAACVTSEVEPDAGAVELLQQPTLVIPLTSGPAPGDGPRDQLYQSALLQMHEAYLERNAGQLAELLDRYDVAAAPSWAREVLPRYRGLHKGLRFEDHVAEGARLQAEPVPIGEPVELTLTLAPLPGLAVALGGEGSEHPTAFRVTFDVEDQDSRGDVVRRQSSSVLRLPDDLQLEGGSQVAIPFTLDLPGMAALIRTVTVRAELMPGYVRVDREQVPHQRVACRSTELTLYPPGVESIRRAPRVTLLRAMEIADVEHFPHVFLAAHFMTEPYREEAMTALMRWVRLGNEGQQRVAMASLAMLADAGIAVGDRRRWLDWWQHRQGR